MTAANLWREAVLTVVINQAIKEQLLLNILSFVLCRPGYRGSTCV